MFEIIKKVLRFPGRGAIITSIVLGSITIISCTKVKKQIPIEKPNIVIIYTDDVGYGDIGINGAIGVKTPNIDLLAQNGLNFTDAHCSAATCTPSRFSLLTGNYACRKNAAVLPGDAPLLIDAQKGTIASMLQKAGYRTAVIGKWHLGLGNGTIDWNEKITPGPNEIGFDYSFIIPATPDRVPCVFVENDRVAGIENDDPIEVSYSDDFGAYPKGVDKTQPMKMDADLQHSGSIINGVSRIGYMKGGKKALWIDEHFADVMNSKVKNFLEENKEHPVFLYYALPNIHVPRLPNSQFTGMSTMGRRGDAIAEMDWYIGKLVKQLEDLGLAENTLMIFSSDNGPILNDGYQDQSEELLGEHSPGGPYRGAKYSVYEAGTRMPTIVYWKGHVKPGVSSAMLSQVDLYASLAALVGQEVQQGDALDSENHMDAWLGMTQKGRDVMLEEAYTFGLRVGQWKYIAPLQGETPEWLKLKRVETGLSNSVQLYNLKNDLSEHNNIAAENPTIVKKMENQLKNILNQ